MVALLLVGTTGTAYAMLRHFNDNIHQVNLTAAMVGKQPPKGKGENILLIGSGTPLPIGNQHGPGQPTIQTHTLMVLHIAANGKWADVMSIPTNSWVALPACVMGNGRLSHATNGPIGQAFSTGNAFGNKVSLGVACLIKTVQNDTKIPINHFIMVNFDGLHSMVAALHGIRVCIPVAYTDPLTGYHFRAGCQWLTASKAVAYARSVYGADPDNTRQLTRRQQQLAVDLVKRARSELDDPLAIYRFVDAVTKSLTIDRGMGGVFGLFRLAVKLHSIPPHKVTFFTVPYYPRSRVVPSDVRNVLWRQPRATLIFTSIRLDKPVHRGWLHA